MKGVVIWLFALGAVVALCTQVLPGQDRKDDGLGGLMDPVDPASLLPTATPTPATGPATRPAAPEPVSVLSQPTGLTPAQQAFGRILDSHSTQLAAMLAKDDNTRNKAQLALLSLQGAFVEGLASQYDTATPEARMRIVDTLKQCAQDARLQRIDSMLSPALRAKLQEFRRLNPRLFLDGISEDVTRRTAAMQAIEKLDDPKLFCEPMILMSIRHPAAQCRVAAMDAALTKDCKGDEIVDAVTDIIMRERESDPRLTSFPDQSGEAVSAPLKATQLLQAWKPARSTPKLMGTLAQEDVLGARYTRDLLVQINDPRCIPLARQMLDSASALITVGVGDDRHGGFIGFAQVDNVLYLLLRLTNQSPDAYGMTSLDSSQEETYGEAYEGMYGFQKPNGAESPRRATALEKFKKWYDKNKDRYKGLEAIRAVRSVPPAPEQVLAYKVGNPAPAATDGVLDVQGLREEIQRMAIREAAGLDNPKPAQRQAAQQRLMAMHERLVAPVVKAAHEPATSQGARQALVSIAAFAEGMAASGMLDKPERTKLTQFRNRQPQVFNTFFTLRWDRQAEVIRSLATVDDSTGAAESLVAMALMHPSPEVRTAACHAAATGRYQSEQIVDLLCQNIQTQSEDTSAAVALGKIGNPRATVYLLEGLKRLCRWYQDNTVAYVEALASTKDLRMVPALVRRLGRSSGSQGWSATLGKRAVSATYSPDDAYFCILLQLTGQKAESYNMEAFSPMPSDVTPRQIGFKNGKIRAEAYDKMRRWWNEHKNDPQYRDLEPLPPMRRSENTTGMLLPNAPERD